ncbi:winged helix-turn-helix domain-containing protein [Arthrobacter sp. MMS18-M83]|uniref:winged helix-turn-helix domain-containing protein n=1 Tax=Arthrobacter sp. MMS18-M83 TaxID=2996261 RepID=UPI00227A7BF6|nr:winged helix-turn-helix domain-containing protein [Arthrobacter sp. MMS18-M83]WAH99161.1 winged helix-turn-helix domain-containing protein [Arthrobacter sp. MMS18-M83]
MNADRSHTAAGALTTGAPPAPAPYSQVLRLKRCGPEPLYYQLAQSLEQAVATGAIAHGTRLLPEKDMARELNVAIGTVRNAWAYLERKGVLHRQRHAGTVIR